MIFENKIDINLLSLNDLEKKVEIKETGATFFENAFIKAKTVYEEFKLPVIADDSGLIVEEIGEPGVFSARYAGENASDYKNNLKLIEKIKHIQNRKAYFECVLVFIDNSGNVHNAVGRCYGEIIEEPRGEKGFGYDPIFFLPELNKTMAELELKEKNKISHRGKAFNKFLEILRGLYV